MMQKENSFYSEVVVSMILILLLILLWHPFGSAMPNKVLMMLMVGLIIVFSIFASFVWRERASDERESLHKMIAGRMAFLVGSAVLVIGIIVQSFAHRLDPYLIFALSAMILAKIVAITYSKLKL